MKTAIFEAAGSMIIQEVAKPEIQAADDVIIKVVRACVCGSDLWAYSHGDNKAAHSPNSGHEAIGLVEEVGSDITSLKPGDFVIVPFVHGCGDCAACQAGFDGSCDNHPAGSNFGFSYQSEYIRFHYGNWALIKIPGQPSDYSEDQIKSLLTLADVMPTGYHAARCAGVKPGDKVVVIGDGAVGQCAVIAAKMMGASDIIMMSRHKERQDLALDFGATAVVAERGQEGIAKVKEILGGGADAALECVGSDASFEQALGVLHNGGRIGMVGLPHYENRTIGSTFGQNISFAGGPASVTTYVKETLLDAVLKGEIQPGKVFNASFSLDQVNDAYQAMADRKAIKSVLVVD